MLKALSNFGCTFTDETDVKRFLEFKEGDLISDPQITRYVLSLGCPVTSVVDTKTVLCPRCRTTFDSTACPQEATIVLANGMIQPNGYTFTYKSGQIVEHKWLLQALEAAGIPLSTRTAAQCPKCQHLF